MFLPIALAALSAVATPTVPKTSIKDVKVGIRQGKVSFHIQGDKPISMKKVTAHNGDKMMIVWVRDAVLGQKQKTFKHRDVTIKAHQHKKSVEFDVVFKKDLRCNGAITLKTSTRGIRALSHCPKVPTALTLAAKKTKAKKASVKSKKAVAKTSPNKVNTPTEPVSPKTDETKPVNPLSLAALEATVTQKEKENASSSNLAAIFFPVLLLLGLAAFGLWLKKKMPQPKTRSHDFNVVRRTHLSPKRSILVTEIEGHRLILASCENGIQLLKDLPCNEQPAQESVARKEIPPPAPKASSEKLILGLVPSQPTEDRNLLAWPKSGLRQTPVLGLVKDAPVEDNAFDKMLSDTAEDDLLRRKIQTSRDLFLA